MPSTATRLTLAAPLVFALLAAPAAAQSREATEHGSRWTHTSIDGGHRLEIRGTGEVELNDEGDWVTGLSSGGRLVVEEVERGRERRAEFRPGAEGVRVLYFEEGRERALDAEGRSWLRRVLGNAVRESGLGAKGRVARIRARRGVAGVLEEVGRIRSDTGRRIYFAALFAGAPLGDDDFRRAMGEVARIRSDTEKRLVLEQAARAAAGGARLAALLEASGTLDSDVESRLVLSRVARDAGLDGDARARGAFFAAVDEIGSAVERRLVLGPVLARANASRALVLDALRSTQGIGSDVEKRLVLTQLPVSRLQDDAISRGFMQAAGTIGSETERSLVLRHLARGGR